MSSSPANCDMMRSNRIVQYLVQILHPLQQGHTQSSHNPEIRRRVGRALHNIGMYGLKIKLEKSHFFWSQEIFNTAMEFLEKAIAIIRK